MRDLKNIDRLFQENLKDFEVSPPIKSWASIEKKLVKPSNKRLIPFWVKISSIAALIALLFSVGTIYLLPTSNFTKNILQKNSETPNVVDDQNEEASIIVEEPTSKLKLTTPLEANTNLNTENIAGNDNEAIENTINEDSEVAKETNPYFLVDAIDLPLQNNNKEINAKEFLNGKLTVATIFAPIYINSFGDGSGVDSQFRENPTSGNSSYSYGVKVAYKLNNKFSVQSGVNLINLGYTTNDIYVTPGVSVLGFSNISNNPILAKNEIASSKEIDNSGSLNQVFGYVEIPVEVKYNVVNGKLGVNVVGGFSTLLLNRDEVFVETSDFSQSLGSSNNLRSVNFSGNIGLDLDYSIHKNLFINVSPMFKVQTNTFSRNSGSIQPYYLGVYTGLNYKF
ncbi:MAG: outer membrane beta-barrel protein [Lutibacter sp.]|uniref:outer membrane beta-barrel protein n=1 Tax=Lutibacter sp. TaxID=1925666 RepID=UPI0017A9C3A8|nr:outer membrane beta-barrel protein [Lutibacter sp.]MBT8317148.1 PorT family protein [Lutibacter sp.]NNJ58008.1 outer membrane beta-barrel protein [Lutibacter sp.]